MSSTRNTKRKRQQGKDNESGSTSRRRSRDERAQASSAAPEPSTEENGGDTEASQKQQITSNTAENGASSDVVMLEGSEAPEPQEKPQQHRDDEQENDEDTAVTTSASTKAPPPINGKSVHSSNPPAADSANSGPSVKAAAASASAASTTIRSSGRRSRSTTPVEGSSTQDKGGRQALHIMTAVEEEAEIQKASVDKETRIRDLIAHRSLLLDRIRTCRGSAEKRLGESTLLSPSTSNNSQGKELTDEEEIAAHREMIKIANQRPKHADGDGATTEKRTSLSLRRGSNVGKRMNAALSTLTPGSQAAAAAAAAAASAAAPSGGSIPTPAVSGTSSINPQQSQKAVGRGAPGTSGAISPKLPPSSTSVVTSGVATSAALATDLSTKPFEAPSGGRGPKSRVPTTSATMHAPPSSLSRPHDPLPTQFSQDPTISSNSPTPRSRLPQPQGPQTYFPEAIALRDQRDEIREKLRALLQRQQEAVQARSAVATSPSTSSSSKRNKLKRPRKVTGLEINAPTTMPQRRRTHWDSLLQEMSWLASDFIQERKWKASSARLLSSQLPQHPLLNRQPIPSTANMVVDNTQNSDEEIKDKKQPADSRRKVKAAAKKTEKAEIEVTDPKPVKNQSTTKSRYPEPSTSEETQAKCSGKILSSMVSELNSAIQKGGATELTNKFHIEGLRNFEHAKSECQKEIGNESTQDSNTPEGAGKMVIDNDPEATNKMNATPHEEISKRVEQLHKLAKSKSKSAAKEFAKALRNGDKINLTSDQKNIVDFVEKMWGGEPTAGAVVSGLVTTGKTFATSTVVWKQKSHGPQLLICPPISILRWKHELDKFSDLRVVLFGASGGISSPDLESKTETPEAGDVVICEYANVGRLKKTLRSKGTTLHSVVVDVRRHGALRSQKSRRGTENAFPPNLVSNEWWDNLAACLQQGKTRCLFVEYDGADLVSFGKSDTGQKEQLVVLAKRTACIIGLDLFASTSMSIHRQMLTWARQMGKTGTVDKMERVKNVLRDTVGPLSFRATEEMISTSDLEWDLRACSMTPLQRQEYEECCLEIRGALSSRLNSRIDTFSEGSAQAVSSALFRLRRLCFHPRTMEILSDDVMKKQCIHDVQGLPTALQQGDNSSQPDAAFAETLLEGAAKLKELVSILISAGHALAKDESIHQAVAPSIDAKEKKSDKTSKKVAILAGLPEIRILISTFLNSVGIRNHLFSVSMNSRSSASNSDGQLVRDEVKWFQEQLLLSRICGEATEDEGTSILGAEVIVAPPAAFAADEGLGLEGADVIVVIDSDWSGRDAPLYDSLLKRWLARNSQVDKEVELVRVVCSDTIETKFFLENDCPKENLAWPLDQGGCFSFPSSEKRTKELYDEAVHEKKPLSSFPAVRVMRERGKLLSDVLMVEKPIPPVFGTGELVRFLPHADAVSENDGKGNAPELRFLDLFLRQEALASLGRLTPSENCSLSTADEASGGVMTRQDLPSLAPLLFLENLAVSHSLIKLTAGGRPSILLSQLTDSTMAGFDSFDGSTVAVEQKPSTLLLYDNRRASSPRLQLSSSHSDGRKYMSDGGSQKRRYNSYAKIFSSSWDGVAVRDGNQGTEPLVFFPPLFPLLEESSKRAKHEYYSSPSEIIRESPKGLPTAIEGSSSNDASVPKRNQTDAAEEVASVSPESKRPRLSSESTSELPPGTDSSTRVDNGVAAEKESSARSVSIGSAVEGDPYMFSEDFGLLGMGAIARSVDAASFSAHDSVLNGGSAKPSDRYDFVSYPIAADTEETNQFVLNDINNGMDSMLLLVKKIPGVNPEYQNGYGRQTTILPGTLGGIPTAFNKKRGSEASMSVGPTAFSRVIPNTLNQLSRKGDYRQLILSSYQSRQRNTGLSMFDSVAYRVSAIRVERRVMDRLERLMWKSTLTFDSGPGLPIQLRGNSNETSTRGKNWFCVAKQLKPGAVTGDSTRRRASFQRAAFQNSMSQPCRVDFGPFHAGFMASPSGQTGTGPGRNRVGVSLPMGVKIMPAMREQRIADPWNAADDKLLRNAVLMFGENWLLIASVMGGIEHLVFENDTFVRAIARSSRECRDRWHDLLRSDPAIGKEARSATKTFRDTGLWSAETLLSKVSKDTDSLVTIASNCGTPIILKSSLLLKEGKVQQKEETSVEKRKSPEKDSAIDGGNATEDDAKPKAIDDDVEMRDAASPSVEDDVKEPPKPKRRSFAAVSIAAARKHVVPITIPGVVSGQPPNQPVPSHPSHIQAVQSSITAQWANGRTEMWPLQILDLADKQRNAAKGRRANGASPSSSRRPQHPHHHPGSGSSHRGPAASRSSGGRPHHGHGSFPSVPPGGRPIAGSPPNQRPSHHHHAPPPHPHHRSPPMPSSAAAQGYSPPLHGSPPSRGSPGGKAQLKAPPPAASPPEAATNS